MNLATFIRRTLIKRNITSLSGFLGKPLSTVATTTVIKPPPCLSSTTLQGLNNNWIWQEGDRFNLPVRSIIIQNGWTNPSPVLIDEPTINPHAVELPNSGDSTSIEAARLIVIRRKKMKKHKLKKLRKRMKYEWIKRRQRRELKKEKEFQARLIQQCKDAEAFSAERYVEEKLANFHNVLKAKASSSKRN